MAANELPRLAVDSGVIDKLKGHPANPVAYPRKIVIRISQLASLDRAGSQE